MSEFIPAHLGRPEQRHAEHLLDTVPNVVIAGSIRPDPTPLTADQMVPIMHCCGRLAFYYTHVPRDNEFMYPEFARYNDGRRVDPKIPPHCGTCGEHITDGGQMKAACRFCDNLMENCKCN